MEEAAAHARQLCPPELLLREEAASGHPAASARWAAMDEEADFLSSAPPPAGLRARLAAIRDRATRTGLLHAAPERPPLPLEEPDWPRAATVPHQPSPPIAASPAEPSPAESAEEAPLSLVSLAHDWSLRPYVPPLGPLNLRVRALADWLREGLAPTSLFVADGQGGPLVEFDASGDFIAAATLLADAARRARQHLPAEDTGPLYLEVGAHGVLTVVSVDTSLGIFHLGIAAAAPLPRDVSRLAARALKRTVEAGG